AVERTGHSGVQFNLDKLNWYNGQFLRRLSVDELVEKVAPYLASAGLQCDPATLTGAVALMQERLGLASEMATEGLFFFEDPTEYDEKGAQKNWKPESAELVRAYADRLEAIDGFTAETAETALRSLGEGRGVGAGKIIHPVRLAVTGRSNGPSLFDLLVVVGQEAVVRRLRRAADVLG
ncbi:MAG TPA: hypothetical protein VK610_10385, partial [Rhodothermales bacterium]|nr:hypothetical protein [Rhodothermales bacterium]